MYLIYIIFGYNKIKCMPIKQKKNKKPEYFIIIPGFKKYLLSQAGEVYFKDSWKTRNQFKRGKSDYTKITDDSGKQIAFNITKALKLYFYDASHLKIPKL